MQKSIVILTNQIHSCRNGIYELTKKENEEMTEPKAKKLPKDLLKSVTESLKNKKDTVKTNKEHLSSTVSDVKKKPKSKPKKKLLTITRTIGVNSLITSCIHAIEREIKAWEGDADIELSKIEREQIIKTIKEQLKA